MEKLDFRLVEAGYDLYATRFQVLRRIIIPLVRPGIVAGSILVFIPALGAYVTPRVLGGGKNLMIGNLIELQFGQGRNWPLGAALSMMLMVDRAWWRCSSTSATPRRRRRRAMAERGFGDPGASPASPTIARDRASVLLYAPIVMLVVYCLQRRPLDRRSGRASRCAGSPSAWQNDAGAARPRCARC